MFLLSKNPCRAVIRHDTPDPDFPCTVDILKSEAGPENHLHTRAPGGDLSAGLSEPVDSRPADKSPPGAVCAWAVCAWAVCAWAVCAWAVSGLGSVRLNGLSRPVDSMPAARSLHQGRYPARKAGVPEPIKKFIAMGHKKIIVCPFGF